MMDSSTSEPSDSTKEFTEILKSLHKKFEIIHGIWTESNKSFEIKFRTELSKNSDYNALCDEWVENFSRATDTVWAMKTSNTGPKVKFRKQYQCWTHGGKTIIKELLFDARKCKASLDIKMFGDNNQSSKRKNKFIRLGLNTVVKIKFTHLHTVNLEQPLAFYVHLCEPQNEVPRTNFDSKIENGATNSIETSSRVNFEATSEIVLKRNDESSSGEALQSFQIVQNDIPQFKLEFHQPNLEQLTQVIISNNESSTNNEQYFMCQPLLLDNAQQLPHFIQFINSTTQQFL